MKIIKNVPGLDGKWAHDALYRCNHSPREAYGVEFGVGGEVLERYFAELCEKCARDNLVPYGRVYLLPDEDEGK